MSDQTPPDPAQPEPTPYGNPPPPPTDNPYAAPPPGATPPPPPSPAPPPPASPYGAPAPAAYGTPPPPPAYGTPPPPPGYAAPTYGGPGYAPAAPTKGSSGLAITALVFSITALVLFWVPFLGILLALVGLVLGIITWSTAGKKRLSKGMPVAATIVSVLALLGGVTVTALVVWLADDVVACSDSSLTPDQQQRCLENRLGVNQ